MEVSAKEITAIEQPSGEGQEPQLGELSSLQLSLVGGGVGEVLFG